MRPMFFLLLVIASLFSAQPAAAQSAERCFPETGFCISGPIRQYWERNGGLPVFGFPVAPQQEELVEGVPLQAQWFERDRLEIQPAGFVTAGRLGARVLELTWRPWQSFGPTDSPGRAGCRYFAETERSACGPFLRYWQANGGLERFGFPITHEFVEQTANGPFLVQYFERRRMEWHPENAGTPYEILLGLLGNETLSLEAPSRRVNYPGCLASVLDTLRSSMSMMIAAETLGCPNLFPPTDIPASVQLMERGEMIWFNPPQIRVPGGVLPASLLTFVQVPGTTAHTGALFSDTWQPGDPDTVAQQPPVGLYSPWRGFAKLWSTDATVRDGLGWARESMPQSYRADYQHFEAGFIIRLYRPGELGEIVFAFSRTSAQKIINFSQAAVR